MVAPPDESGEAHAGSPTTMQKKWGSPPWGGAPSGQEFRRLPESSTLGRLACHYQHSIPPLNRADMLDGSPNFKVEFLSSQQKIMHSA
jgi:hypothetical protein